MHEPSLRRGRVVVVMIMCSSIALVRCVGDEPATNGGDTNDTDATTGDGSPSTDGAVGDGSNPSDGATSPSGVLDTTFQNGIVTGVQMTVYAVTVDSDGRVYLAGGATCTNLPADAGYSNNDMAVARFLADGSVDTSYGTGGRACLAVGTSGSADYATGIAIDPSGRAVLAGTAFFNSGDFTGTNVVGRLTANGQPDTTFGTNSYYYSVYGGAQRTRVHLDGGFIYVIGNEGASHGFVLKLDANGAPVTAFGPAGLREPPTCFNGGAFQSPNIFGAGGTAAYGASAIALEGYVVTDGTDAGRFQYSLSDSGADFGRDLELSGSDFLVSATIGVTPEAGLFSFPPAIGKVAAFKITTAGTIDTTWAAPSGAFVSPSLASFGAETKTSLVQPGGQLVLSGLIDATVDISGISWDGDGALTRVKADGTLDTSFGTSGIYRLGTSKNSRITDIALDPRNAAIVVVGLQANNLVLNRLTP